MNKIVALLVAFLAAANAFAPVQPQSKAISTELNALFDRINNMDLFKKETNMYGARSKKNLKVAEIKGGYVPDGLTEEQYNQIRKEAVAKKEANYQRNVKKAGIFENFTEFYKQRGTSEGGAWLKGANRGHKMVKTKYDWSGEKKR
jgi:hypothetical protein